MKKNRIFVRILAVVLILIVLLVAFVMEKYHRFNQGDGVDSGLISEPEEYLEFEVSTQVGYRIVEKSRLVISNMYLIEREDEVQLRFRVGYPWAFTKENLLFETKWKIEDSSGDLYKMRAFSGNIGGMECVNGVIAWEKEAFEALSGDTLTITLICSTDEDYLNVEKSYAHCELEVLIP